MFLGNLAAQGYDCVIDLACFEPGGASRAVELFRGRVNQYIFVSTVDVYTKPARVCPIDENVPRKLRPPFLYPRKNSSVKKSFSLRIFFAAHGRKAFHLTVFRPAHTHGERVTPLLEVFGWEAYHLDRLKKVDRSSFMEMAMLCGVLAMQKMWLRLLLLQSLTIEPMVKCTALKRGGHDLAMAL